MLIYTLKLTISDIVSFHSLQKQQQLLKFDETKKLQATDFHMKHVSHNIAKAFLGPFKDMNDMNFDFALFELSRTVSNSKQTSQVLSHTL